MRKILRWSAYALILAIPFFLGIMDIFKISIISRKWITAISIVLFVVSLIFDIWDKLNLQKYKNFQVKVELLEQILNKSFDIFKKKKNALMDEISAARYSEKDIIYYSVHEHMRFIIIELKDCICDITGVDPKNLSVHFMYKHTNDKKENWKWIDWDNVSVSHTLKKLLHNKNSCYYRVLHTNEKYIFENDKLKAIADEKYISSDRDQYYNKIGSIVCEKIDCGRYGKSYIEGIVSISTYGKKLIKSDKEKEIEEFDKTLKYQILPYYNALLEIEMASLSLRHSLQNKK